MSGRAFVPRYYEIEQSLRARIVELEPDAPLPSDAQLCREFGVSRMTARNAVQRLVQEGLVYRLPGRGTYVADYGSHRKAGSLTSFTEEMRREGRIPTSQVLLRGIRQAATDEAEQLQLAEESNVVVVRRVRLADDEPIALESTVLRIDAAPAVLGADLTEGSLQATLVGAGLVPTSGRGTLGSEPASREEARLLDVGKGWPLLVERRQVSDQHGAPLELTETRYAACRYSIDVEFVVTRRETG